MVRPLVHRNTKNEVDYINYDDVIFYPERHCKLEEPDDMAPMTLLHCSSCGMKTAVAYYCSWCGAKVISGDDTDVLTKPACFGDFSSHCPDELVGRCRFEDECLDAMEVSERFWENS